MHEQNSTDGQDVGQHEATDSAEFDATESYGSVSASDASSDDSNDGPPWVIVDLIVHDRRETGFMFYIKAWRMDDKGKFYAMEPHRKMECLYEAHAIELGCFAHEIEFWCKKVYLRSHLTPLQLGLANGELIVVKCRVKLLNLLYLFSYCVVVCSYHSFFPLTWCLHFFVPIFFIFVIVLKMRNPLPLFIFCFFRNMLRMMLT